MTINPVYRRESMVSSRSMRLPLIIGGFNLILALFALFSMLAAISHSGASMAYSSFLMIFRYAAIIEFVLIVFIIPALTAGSISGEREHRTLELMLTTKLTPFDIIIGKMMTALTTIGIIVVSSVPIMALIFVYGGISITDMLQLLFTFATAAVFTASVGIWASSVSSRSSVATAIAYALVLLLFAGTAGLCFLISGFTGENGSWIKLLIVNPASTFYGVIGNMTGFRNRFGSRRWLLYGSTVQIMISAVFTAVATGSVKPRNKH